MNEASGNGQTPSPRQRHRCKKMQSDDRSSAALNWKLYKKMKEQFHDQQAPEGSEQRHHSPGVERKSLEDLLCAAFNLNSKLANAKCVYGAFLANSDKSIGCIGSNLFLALTCVRKLTELEARINYVGQAISDL